MRLPPGWCRFLVDAAVPQTYTVLETRAQPLGIRLEQVDLASVSQ